jgi:hypothetical protein
MKLMQPRSAIRGWGLIYLFIAILLVSTASLLAGQQKHECIGTGHELGEAVDIGALNNKPVSLYGKDSEVTKMVEKTQDAFNHPADGGPPPMENYGPAGLYHNGQRFNDKKLQENHSDHIHIRMASQPKPTS